MSSSESITKNPPKAFLTDVFGTVVDWRSTVTRHLTECASVSLNDPARSLASTLRLTCGEVSWGDVAQAWRLSYYRFTRHFNPDEHGGRFVVIDDFFRTSLGELVDQYGLTGLWSEAEMDGIAKIWHELVPWPDSPAGIGSLSGNGFQVATLSNGSVRLLENLARFGELPYTAILSAENFGAYKPAPQVYLGAAEKLGLRPDQCAMVAAHLGDLAAAHQHGMKTIYIERRQEEEWDVAKVDQAKKDGWVDMWIPLHEQGFVEVARRFGIAHTS